MESLLHRVTDSVSVDNSAMFWLSIRFVPTYTNSPFSPIPFRTFVVEDSLHLHGGPRMSDAEHGAGHQALQCRRAVCCPDEAPVWLVVTPLQHLHGLTPAHRQLVAVAGHEVVYDHGQLTATRELWRGRRAQVWFVIEARWNSTLNTCGRVSPCRCPGCSVKCGMRVRWCLVGCCLHPDCPDPLHPYETHVRVCGRFDRTCLLSATPLCVRVACLPSSFVVLGCTWLWDVNGLLECSS